MSEEKFLEATVHHKGQVYRAGTSSEQIGEVASEFGDHCWVGGKGPGKVSGDGNPLAGTPSGRPPVPTPSALPTPGSRIDAPDEGDGGEQQGGEQQGGSRRSGRSGRAGS